MKPLEGCLECILCGSAGKESTCNAGDLGLIPGVGRSPGEGKGSPWGHKESDTTERLVLQCTWNAFKPVA